MDAVSDRHVIQASELYIFEGNTSSLLQRKEAKSYVIVMVCDGMIWIEFAIHTRQ